MEGFSSYWCIFHSGVLGDRLLALKAVYVLKNIFLIIVIGLLARPILLDGHLKGSMWRLCGMFVGAKGRRRSSNVVTGPVYLFRLMMLWRMQRTFFLANRFRFAVAHRWFHNGDVEAALAKAQAKLDIIPQKACDEIVRNCDAAKFDFQELKKQTERIGYPVLPVVNQLVHLCDDGSSQ